MTLASPADRPHEPVYDADFLRRVIDATNDAIAVHRAIRDDWGAIADFEMVFVNRVLEAMFPEGSGNWVGRRLRTHLPATLEDGRYQLLVDAVEAGEPRRTEVEARFLRGTTHRLLLHAIPQGDEVVVSLRDITTEHEALTALAESERRYRDLVEHQAELVCRFLPDTTILFANETFAGYYGQDAGDVVGARVIDLVPPHRAEELVDLVASLGPEQPTITVESYVDDADGNRRWHQWSVSAAVIEGGVVTEVQAVGIDVTDRKRAEIATQARSEVLALVGRISQRFIDLPIDEVDAGIEAALGDLGRALGVDRAHVVLYRSDHRHLDMTHEWCREGVESARRFIVGVPDEAMPRIRETLHRGETVRIGSFAIVEEGWDVERTLYAHTGVESTMVMPIIDDGRLVGSVGFDVIGRSRQWSEHEATLLGTAAVSFGQVLARREADAEMRRSERRYRALVAGIPDLLIRVDSDLRILDWRPFAHGQEVPLALGAVGDRLADVLPELVAPVRRVLASGGDGSSQVDAFEVAWGGRAASLEARVTVASNEAIAVVRDVTEQHRLQRSLLHQATHDALTGLANRRLFSEQLDQALARARDGGGRPAVLFIDLDQFKVLNDSQGHDVGDSVLRSAARRLIQAVRPGDVVARLGGDEFAVLSHRVNSSQDAVSLAERLVAATSEPVEVDGDEVVITASIGVVLATGESTTASMLRDADAAMYQAKAKGRRRVELFSEEIREAALARHRVEHDLRRALVSGQLELYYQPLWSLARDRWVGLEALVRWNHPTRGLLLPGAFLRVAEDAGLMSRLSDWVLDRACQDMCRLGPILERDLRVWVNLAADQLMAPGLVDEVEAALDANGLPAASLGVEVTETAVVGDILQAQRSLAALRRMGVAVALDDFGTGLSSLTHLDSLPLDVVKLDGAFVAGAMSEGRQRDLVDGIVTLVRRLGLEVLAERVEGDAEVEALRGLGVDSLQGFYFGRPAPVTDVPELLSRHRTLASS